MKKLKIDLQDLMMAFEHHSFEISHFLDLETGEILLVSEDETEKERQKIYEKIDGESDRFAHIEPLSSHEGYRIMEDFINTVTDPQLQHDLSTAIRGKGAFRRFKDALYAYPGEQKRYFAFYEEKLKEEITAWLEGLGIVREA